MTKTTLLLAALLTLLTPLHATSSLAGRTIVIDPGHGTINYDAEMINEGKKTKSGSIENVLTMGISEKLGKRLQEQGAQVIYTRTRDDYWRQSYSSAEDNKARALFANELNADVFLSIHCDWDPRSKISGVSTYYKEAHSYALGESIQRKMISLLKARNRGLRRDSYTVLDNTKMPAVLIETGYLSNRVEGKKLTTRDYQEKVAQAIMEGLRVYFSK